MRGKGTTREIRHRNKTGELVMVAGKSHPRLRGCNDRLPGGHLEREVRMTITLQRKVCALGKAPLLLSIRNRVHAHVTLPRAKRITLRGDLHVRPHKVTREGIAKPNARWHGRRRQVQGIPRRKVNGNVAPDIEEIKAKLALVIHAASPHTEGVWGIGDGDVIDMRVVWQRLDLQHI